MRNEVPEPVTLIDEVEEVTFPVRLLFAAAHVPALLQLPVAVLVMLAALANDTVKSNITIT